MLQLDASRRHVSTHSLPPIPESITSLAEVHMSRARSALITYYSYYILLIFDSKGARFHHLPATLARRCDIFVHVHTHLNRVNSGCMYESLHCLEEKQSRAPKHSPSHSFPVHPSDPAPELRETLIPIPHSPFPFPHCRLSGSGTENEKNEREKKSVLFLDPMTFGL